MLFQLPKAQTETLSTWSNQWPGLLHRPLVMEGTVLCLCHYTNTDELSMVPFVVNWHILLVAAQSIPVVIASGNI